MTEQCDRTTDLRLALLPIVLAIAGCGPNPDMPMYQQSAKAATVDVQDNERVTVTRIGVFRDDIAYESRRGVYVIQDKKSGQEFIGVSGVGIVETGGHSCGKACTTEDER